jgi:hypothetical protein
VKGRAAEIPQNESKVFKSPTPPSLFQKFQNQIQNRFDTEYLMHHNGMVCDGATSAAHKQTVARAARLPTGNSQEFFANHSVKL